MGLYLVLPSFIGFYWVFWALPSFTEFHWVLLGFTGFYRVLPSFTGFYLVLLGFTGFYWVSVPLSGRTEFAVLLRRRRQRRRRRRRRLGDATFVGFVQEMDFYGATFFCFFCPFFLSLRCRHWQFWQLGAGTRPPLKLPLMAPRGTFERAFTEYYRVLLGFTGFYWVFMFFSGFYRVLPGFTGIYRVLSVFRRFYRILRGFTGFYRVLLGFTEFYRVFFLVTLELERFWVDKTVGNSSWTSQHGIRSTITVNVPSFFSLFWYFLRN